ncbi:MAG: arylsulfatase [Planctomycetota bacterium]|jgi:arylsulfatase
MIALMSIGMIGSGCSDSALDEPFDHIILISLDTTRADHLGCYGSDKGVSSAIDAIASKGVVFRDVTAPAPTTLSSHTSMMTGSYSQTHGVARNGFLIHEDNQMLAELLQARGFHTAAVLGSFALERRFGFNQGFDHFDEEFDVLILPGGVDQNQRSAERVTDAALAHVDEAKPEKLFLFTHYFDAHLPYNPPPEVAKKHVQEGQPMEVSLNVAENIVAGHQYKITGKGIGLTQVASRGLDKRWIEEALERPLRGEKVMAALYAAEIEEMDAHIGRLLRELDKRGYLERALVIITGDHGETFWEHGNIWNHGLWTHQTTVAIPLIMRFPQGDYASREVMDPVSTVDLVPTLVELLGIKQPPLVEGTSLVPALEGSPFERGPVYSQATQPVSRFEEGEAWQNMQKPRCVRDGKWKYIHAPYLELEQLFDLEVDPGETSNLLRSEPVPADAVQAHTRLKALMADWIASARPLSSEMSAVQMLETMQRLKAMGYGGGEEEE